MGLLHFTVTGIIYTVISVGLCHLFSAEAVGAGFIEIKCILAGGNKTKVLEF